MKSFLGKEVACLQPAVLCIAYGAPNSLNESAMTRMNNGSKTRSGQGYGGSWSWGKHTMCPKVLRHQDGASGHSSHRRQALWFVVVSHGAS